jgi:hypothetical protein
MDKRNKNRKECHFNTLVYGVHPKNYTTCTRSYVWPIVGITHYCRWTDQDLVENTPIIGAISTNSWRVSKFWQYLQTLYRTPILEFNRFLTDFGYELSNNKCEQILPSSIICSWRFFRAKVDQLHVSNNASHIFFSVFLSLLFAAKTIIKKSHRIIR